MMIIFADKCSGTQQTYLEAVTRALRKATQRPCVVGLIAPTGRLLLDAWQAAILEGHTPIILQYPTPKLSRVYWQSEIAHAVTSVGVDVLICANTSCAPVACQAKIVLLTDPRPDASPPRAFELPAESTFLQMSSGTTGFKKGIRFHFADVIEHVRQYNKVLRIDASKDCIVSWLPLYHDMGFIATFLMPQILGCKLVLMDPIAWVRNPTSLWDAIDAHDGTICYMPNFGFEVMSANARPVPESMRLWISCSEPTRAETMARFSGATGAAPQTLSNCWAMAENIFAVTQSTGIHVRRIDGIDVVSCGEPVPGVQMKIVDDQIWVRSAYSLVQYEGVEARVDSDGFYASGDVGDIIDGQIYLKGRLHDVMINAGRKTLLSDVDFLVGEEIPECAGRVAAFEVVDENMGTGALRILAEDPKFWRRNRDGDTMKRVIARTGMETARLEFVPPRFITKTSSGKVNRKITRANWQKRLGAPDDAPGRAGVNRALSEIRASFPWLNFEQPLFEQIDSLGVVNFSLILDKNGISHSVDVSQPPKALLTAAEPEANERQPVIRIVSLADGNPFRALAGDALADYVARAPHPVQFKSICVPPLPVLFSDLVFYDYFRCRDPDQDKYDAIRRVMTELKNASVILIDDSVTLFWPQSESAMIYPQLSHDFQPGEGSELLGVRWAGYSENHHLLATTMHAGVEMPRERMNELIYSLSDYLGVPVVRVSYGADYPELTADWEVRCQGSLRGATAAWNFDGIDRADFSAQLMAALERASSVAPVRTGDQKSFINFADQPHWCSWPINRDILDFIVENFDDLVVLGKRSSVPYLHQRAEALGKRVRVRPDLNVPEDCDCVVQAGSWGKPETDKPIFQVMAAGWLGEPAINLPAHLEGLCPPNRG